MGHYQRIGSGCIAAPGLSYRSTLAPFGLLLFAEDSDALTREPIERTILMKLIHKWTVAENGDHVLHTSLSGVHGSLRVPAVQIAEAPSDAKKLKRLLEEQLATKLLLKHYPPKHEALEPVLASLLRLIHGEDHAVAKILLAQVRAIAYAQPVVKVERSK